MMGSALHIVLALAAVAGLLLAVIGARGWRIGSFPACRRCGFDLSGRRMEAGADREPCPECGADLERSGGVARGARRRRPVMAWGGALLLLAAGAWLGTLVFGGSAVHRYKPLGLILFEAGYADAGLADELGAELKRREAASIFAAEDADRIIAVLLEIQADRARPWSSNYGDLLETIGMTPEQSARYSERMVSLELRARERVSLGSPIPVAIRVGEVRSGANTSTNLRLYVHKPVIDGEPASFVRAKSSGPAGSPYSVTNIRISPHLAPGPSLVLIEPDTANIGARAVALEVGVVSDTKVFRDAQEMPLRVVEVGDVEIVEGPTARVDVDRTVSVESTGSEPRLTVLSGRDAVIPPYLALGRIAVDAPLAHRVVFVRPDGTETEVGWYTMSPSVHSIVPPGERIGPEFMDGSQPVFCFSNLGIGGVAASLGQTVDVPDGTRAVLRADPWFAERTLDVFELPAGEIDLGEIVKQTR